MVRLKTLTFSIPSGEHNEKSTSLIAALITSLSLCAAHAAPPKPKPGPAVTTTQIDKIQVGQTQEEIITLLGNPRSMPKWRNGTHSLVYAVSDRTGKQTLYVDIENSTNKVIRSVVMPESSADSSSDSGTN